MIRLGIPIAYDFRGLKGGMIFELSFCDGNLTPEDGNYLWRRFKTREEAVREWGVGGNGRGGRA